MNDIYELRETFGENIDLKIGKGFNPSQLTDLQLWVDASDGDTLFQDSAGTVKSINDGDVIGRWKDKSGKGRHTTQGTTPDKPVLRISQLNGRPTLQCVNDYVGNINLPLDNFHAFFVIRFATIVDANSVFMGNDSAVVFLRHVVNSGIDYRGNDNVYDTSALGTNTSPDTWYIFEFQYQNTTLTGRRGGNSIFNDTNTTNTTYTIQRLLARGSEKLAGNCAEIIIFDRVLLSQEQSLIRNYLTQKWGLAA